jgi:hypothetical protein
LVRNPILKYSVERLLHEANPEGGTYFGATAFNKMIFLSYTRLLENSVDLKLPYYWYLQGSLIEENQFEEDVGQPREYYITSDHSSRRMMKVPVAPISGDIQDIIDRQIQSLVQHYRQPNGYFKKGYLDLLLDDVYGKAPYQFQRVFNRDFIPFLNSFKTPSRKQVPVSLTIGAPDKEKIESFLDESFRVFPRDDMLRIYDSYVEWDDTARVALESDEKRIFPMTDTFWKFFCHNLRILQNENLSPQLVRHWDSRFIENDLPKYENTIERLRRVLLKKWKKGQDDDKETDDIVKKLNLISRNGFGRQGT